MPFQMDESFVDELGRKKHLQKLLYRRGYLITNRENLNTDEYPFWGNWNTYRIGNEYRAYIHPDQHFYRARMNDADIVLIGHAYNPFTMDSDENVILRHLGQAFGLGNDAFFEKVSELTGIFVLFVFAGGKVLCVQDCTAMKACYYGAIGRSVYFASHCAMIADIDTPTENRFAGRLIRSYVYRHFGTEYLPGDITVFNELRRLGPNVFLTLENGSFSVDRFFPKQPHPEVPAENTEVIDRITEILQNNLTLCAEKWARPAISLSGGMDSRTTLSASVSQKDRFYYYSFYCKQQEYDDAYAAHDICGLLGIEHHIYPIPEESPEYSDFALYKEVIARNNAYVNIPGDHEIRKYIFLSALDDFDAELKSWSSEIGRAYWERRYGMRLPDKLLPRDFSAFQTRFVGTPFLMKQNDDAYASYLQRSGFVYPLFNYEHTDMFYWEFRFGSNGTYVTMGQDIFNFEVTMPMNNRLLMDMFLWYPHDSRKNDDVHKAVILKCEPRFREISIDVHNGYFSGRRIALERLYYRYRTMLQRRG